MDYVNGDLTHLKYSKAFGSAHCSQGPNHELIFEVSGLTFRPGGDPFRRMFIIISTGVGLWVYHALQTT